MNKNTNSNTSKLEIRNHPGSRSATTTSVSKPPKK